MNKNILIVLIAALFAIFAIAFSYYQKHQFNQELHQINTTKKEILYIKDLERIWSAKGIKRKIQRALSQINSRKKTIEIKRKKVTINLNDLTDKEINKALSKLASLPLQFKELKLNKSGENFNMECKCVW